MLSPSTRSTDLTLQRALYEAHGTASYWVLDPLVPALTVLELEQARYVERTVVRGGDSWAVERPFLVTVVPAESYAPDPPGHRRTPSVACPVVYRAAGAR